MNTQIIVLTLLILGAQGPAQEPVLHAGGNWLHFILSDPLFDNQSEVFSLESDNTVPSSIDEGRVRFAIFCAGGKWQKTVLGSPSVLIGDSRSPLTGQEQQTIIMLTDGKLHVHAWNISASNTSMFVDHGATLELVKSQQTRIQFVLFPGRKVVAVFSAVDLNQVLFQAACGGVKKRK